MYRVQIVMTIIMALNGPSHHVLVKEKNRLKSYYYYLPLQ